MAKQPLRALFFDVDDTIYSTTEFAQSARRNSIRAMISAGLRVEEEEALRELEEVIREFSSNHEHHFDKLLQRLPPETYDHSIPALLVAAGMAAYHDTKIRDLSPYEDAIEVLRLLRERGLRLGIITQGVAIKQAEKIVRLGLHKLVDARFIFITGVIGIAKSNPKIFHRACRSVEAPPESCAYVGDNPPLDVDVPHQIGMRAILSRRSGKYAETDGKTEPEHVVHNFWDLLEIVEQEYEIQPASGGGA